MLHDAILLDMKFYSVPDAREYEGRRPGLGKKLMSLGVVLAVLPGVAAVILANVQGKSEGLLWLGFLGPYPILAALTALGFIFAILGSMLFVGWGFWAPVKLKKKPARKRI